MPILNPSGGSPGGVNGDPLFFQGWASDDADPANVSSAGGSINTQGGNVDASSGSGTVSAHTLSAHDLGLTGGSIAVTGAGAISLAGGTVSNDNGTNLARLAPGFYRVESDSTNEGYEARIGSGITSTPPVAVPAFTADPSNSGTIALDAGGLIVRNVGKFASAPAASSAPTLALGTAYQNTLGYDALLVVYLSITVNTSGVVKLGVGPTSTPTQQTIVTGVTTIGFLPVTIYLPSLYYALLSISGTITDSIAGQIAMPV